MFMTALLTFGLLILAEVRWTFAVIAAPLGVLAFFHGVSLGPPIAAETNRPAFVVGLILGSAILYAVGYMLGHLLCYGFHRWHSRWTHPAGGRLAH